MTRQRRPAYLSCALDFQEATGLRNIGRYYVMPDGLSMKEMQILRIDPINNLYGVRQLHRLVNGQRALALEDPASFSKVHKIYEQWVAFFKRRNPDLKIIRIEPGNLRHLYDMARGVTSGINPQDIDYFINELKRNNAFMQRLATLRERTAQVFGAEIPKTWIPSPHTADRIETALSRKEKKLKL